MKRKAKRYDEGGGVEEMKQGLFAAKEPKEEVTDDRFKAAVQANTKLPSAKESSGTSYNTEYKEPVKAKPKKPETSQTTAFGTNTDKYDKQMRMHEKQRLGELYGTMYGRLQDKGIPEGRGKEELKKAVAKAGKDYQSAPMKKGGAVKKMASGGSASSRGDGCAMRGKTRGRIV